LQHRRKCLVQTGHQLEGLLTARQRQGQFRGGQEQPGTFQVLLQKPVVLVVTVAAVTEDGMRQVAQVAPDLVRATRVGHGLHQRIAAGGIAPHRQGQFHGVQARKARQGGLGRPLPVDRRLIPGQRYSHLAAFGNVAPHDSQIDLRYILTGKSPVQRAGRAGAQGEHQHTGGRPVQAMNGIQPGAYLITQFLQHVATTTRIARPAVDLDPRRFVNGHQVVVLEKDLEHARCRALEVAKYRQHRSMTRMV